MYLHEFQLLPFFVSRVNIHLYSRKSLRKRLLLFFRISHDIIIITILIEREDASFLFFSGDPSCGQYLPFFIHVLPSSLLSARLGTGGEDRLLNKIHYFFQIFPVKIV